MKTEFSQGLLAGGGTWHEPTMHLRFFGGRLQQLWVRRGGAASHSEWRNIEDEAPAQEPAP